MESASQEYRTVVLAALLHAVGEFLQRGDFGSHGVTGEHLQSSADFVSAFVDHCRLVADVDLLKTLVQRHHEGTNVPDTFRVQDSTDPHVRSLAHLVSHADLLSSSEHGERAERWRDYRTVRLASVFGRLELTGGPPAQLRYVRPRALGAIATLSEIFPDERDRHEVGELSALLSGFQEEFRRLTTRLDWSNFDTVFTHLLALLQKYTSCVPSDTQDAIPDVSLYDHAKTAVAIAACLYRYHRSRDDLSADAIIRTREPRFLLVAGDLSGIQDYLFGIAHVGAGGIAKRLRARSLFIQLLADSVSHRLVRCLDLPIANILMTSGGRFYVLLPNVAEATGVVNAVQREVDRWLIEELNGEIGLNLAAVAFGDEGFEATAEGGFGGVLERLAQQLAIRKRRRFAEALQDDEGWKEDAFLRPVDFRRGGACAGCGKLPAEHDDLCAHCLRDTRIGGRIPTTRFLAFNDGPNGAIPLVWHSCDPIASPRELTAQPYLVVRLNETDLADVVTVPATFRYLANYIPRTDGAEPIDFDGIAARSRGRPMLGYLKADVDRLGEAFVFGLRREAGEVSYDTVSRLATLSRSLDLFFSGWVEHLLREAFPECYTVFSGGDDLLLVGPWDQMLELAQRIEADFRRYTGHPALTLSAGIAVTKPGFPLSRAADEADRALETSKRLARDRITVFGRTLTWLELRTAVDDAELLAEASPSSAFLFSLRRYGELWCRYDHGRGDILALRFQPLLAYNVARNLDPHQHTAMYDWVKPLIGLRPSDPTQAAKLDRLAFVSGLAILLRRK